MTSLRYNINYLNTAVYVSRLYTHIHTIRWGVVRERAHIKFQNARQAVYETSQVFYLYVWKSKNNFNLT